MNETEIVRILSSIVLQSVPLIIAVLGETITERAGVINLSLDGSMLMAAMTGFVVGYETDSVVYGFMAAAAVGALFALIVAFGSIRLRQSQVAIGFVLTLLGDDLSAFLGQNYTRLPGPVVRHYPIPVLKDIPLLGPMFFNHDILVYLSFILIGVIWWFLYRTRHGLYVRAAGERPEAAFARGLSVNQIRYLSTIAGGMLVGIAGAAFTFSVKIGWSEGHTRGMGWIALAIVIFGGWSPVKGALGAVLFGATKALATYLQRAFPQVSVVAFNAIPWVLMIAVLLVVGSEASERFVIALPKPIQRPFRRLMQIRQPLALGTSFGED